eukprot:m.254920 g.254920  ORF g.254920 m.254920 type:complete len:1648 (+) comp18886_c0_seq1:285-5228(+)
MALLSSLPSHAEIALYLASKYDIEPSSSLDDVLLTIFGPTRGVCNRQWGLRELAYRCLDCQRLDVTAFCKECFQQGGHEDHQYVMYISTSGGTCDCGMPGTMDMKFCCPKHGLGMADTHELEEVLASGRLDELCACFQRHLKASLDGIRSSILFLQELSDKHWALRYMVFHSTKLSGPTGCTDWIHASLSEIIRRHLQADITALVVSLIPVPEMKDKLTEAVLARYREFTSVHFGNGDANTLTSEHVRLTVQIFSSPGHMLPVLLQSNTLCHFLANLLDFTQRAHVIRKNFVATQEPESFELDFKHTIFEKLQYWALICDLKDYVASDNSIVRKFLTHTDTMTAFANLCMHAELALSNVRLIDTHVAFDDVSNQSFRFSAFVEASMYFLTCHSFFYLWSPDAREELAQPDSILMQGVLKGLEICFGHLRRVLSLQLAQPDAEIFSVYLPLHRHIAILLSVVRHHRGFDGLCEVLEHLGRTSGDTSLTPTQVMKELVVWPLRLLASRARYRVGMWKRNGNRVLFQMYTYTLQRTPNNSLADLFLVQLFSEFVTPEEFVHDVSTAFLRDTPWHDVVRATKTVEEAFADVDEIDRLALSWLVEELELFLMAVLQDTPHTDGNVQSIVDAHVQGCLALGPQGMSKLDTFTMSDPIMARHINIRDAMQRLATFHPATVSHGTMRQGYFKLKEDQWDKINWPHVFLSALNHRSVSEKIDNYVKVMRLTAHEVSLFQHVVLGSWPTFQTLLVSKPMMRLQETLFNGMLQLKSDPGYSPIVVGGCLSLVAAALQNDIKMEHEDSSPSVAVAANVLISLQRLEHKMAVRPFCEIVRHHPALAQSAMEVVQDEQQMDEGPDTGKQQRRKRAKGRRERILGKFLQQSADFMQQHHVESSEDELDDRTHPHRIIIPPVVRTQCVVCQRNITSNTEDDICLLGHICYSVGDQCRLKQARDLCKPLIDGQPTSEELYVLEDGHVAVGEITKVCQHYAHARCLQASRRCPMCQTSKDVRIVASIVPEILAKHHCFEYHADDLPVLGAVQRLRVHGGQDLSTSAKDETPNLLAERSRQFLGLSSFRDLKGLLFTENFTEDFNQAWHQLQEESAYLHYLSHSSETTVNTYQPGFSCRYHLFGITHLAGHVPRLSSGALVDFMQGIHTWLQSGSLSDRSPLEMDTVEFVLLLLLGSMVHAPFTDQDFATLAKATLLHAVSRSLIQCGIAANPLLSKDGDEGCPIVFSLEFDDEVYQKMASTGIYIETLRGYETYALSLELISHGPLSEGLFVVQCQPKRPGAFVAACCVYLQRGIAVSIEFGLTQKQREQLGSIIIWPVKAEGFIQGPIRQYVERDSVLDLDPVTQTLLLGNVLASPASDDGPSFSISELPRFDSARANIVESLLNGTCQQDLITAARSAFDAEVILDAIEYALRLLVVLKCSLYKQPTEVPTETRDNTRALIETHAAFLNLDGLLGGETLEKPDLLCKTLFSQWPDLVPGWLRLLNMRLHIRYPTFTASRCLREVPGWILPRVPRLLDIPETFAKFYHKYCEDAHIEPDPARAGVCLLCGKLVSLYRGHHQQSGTDAVQHAEECCLLLLRAPHTYVYVTGRSRSSTWGTFFLDEFDEEDFELARGRKLLLNKQRLSLLHEDWLRHRVETRHDGP